MVRLLAYEIENKQTLILWFAVSSAAEVAAVQKWQHKRCKVLVNILAEELTNGFHEETVREGGGDTAEQTDFFGDCDRLNCS